MPQCHRLNAQVHIADTRPPELIPVVALERVHHKVTFLRQATTRTRAASSSPRKMSTLKYPRKSEVDDVDAPIQEEHSEANLAQLLTPEPSQGLESPSSSQHDVAVALSEENCTPDQPQPATLSQTPTQTTRKRKRLSASLPLNQTSKRDYLLFSDIEKLVDAALRLSVLKSTPKLPTGIRAVTHTFARSLSDVCPSMWSPHFLLVLKHDSTD